MMIMMIAEDLMEDQEVVLVEEVSVVAPAALIRGVEAVLQMDVAEIAQAADHLLVQEVDAVVLQTDVAVLQMDAVLQTAAVRQADAVILHRQEEATVLPAMEDVAAKKVVLLQTDKFCIETIKEK